MSRIYAFTYQFSMEENKNVKDKWRFLKNFFFKNWRRRNEVLHLSYIITQYPLSMDEWFLRKFLFQKGQESPLSETVM